MASRHQLKGTVNKFVLKGCSNKTGPEAKCNSVTEECLVSNTNESPCLLAVSWSLFTEVYLSSQPPEMHVVCVAYG